MVAVSCSTNPAKTVYLIRHAESEENQKVNALTKRYLALGKSFAEIFSSKDVLEVVSQVDSNVTDVGEEQIKEMGEELKETDFLASSGVKLVAHSPLVRARKTSEGLLGCQAPHQKADTVERVLELELLAEKTPQEWKPTHALAFKRRITAFEHWLARQPEDRIAIVGHSEYFKDMLGLDFRFGNCDVWSARFDPEATEASMASQSRWRELKKLYTSRVGAAPQAA